MSEAHDVDVIVVEPRLAPMDAVVAVPGSKSIANRALLVAAIADGDSELANVPDGDDTEAMIDCLQALGVAVGRNDRGGVAVSGGVRHFRPGPIRLDARLAGTTSRFITALAALGPGPYTIDGGAPLRARPMSPLHEALRGLGASVDAADRPGHLPVTVRRGQRSDSSAIRIAGDISSQFLSALMMVAPVLGGVRLALTSPLVSRPYVELTQAVMRSFGIDDIVVDETSIVVPPGSYRSCRYAVEPDASSASYPMAVAAITGGRVTIGGLGDGALQGDARFADVLEQMGCSIVRDQRGTTVAAPPADTQLRGIDIDMSDISDLVPTLAVVGACAATPTTIRGVGFIRHKESDRLGDLAHELRRCGVDIDETADGLHVRPSHPHGARLGTHHDHRLAMAFAVLGQRVPGIEIESPGVVTKSWPSFWAELASW